MKGVVNNLSLVSDALVLLLYWLLRASNHFYSMCEFSEKKKKKKRISGFSRTALFDISFILRLRPKWWWSPLICSPEEDGGSIRAPSLPVRPFIFLGQAAKTKPERETIKVICAHCSNHRDGARSHTWLDIPGCKVCNPNCKFNVMVNTLKYCSTDWKRFLVKHWDIERFELK